MSILLLSKKIQKKLVFDFDGRQWVADFADVSSDEMTVKYTLKNETIENWNELVTTYSFPGLKADDGLPSDMSSFFYEDSLLSRCRQPNWKEIYKTKHVIIAFYYFAE